MKSWPVATFLLAWLLLLPFASTQAGSGRFIHFQAIHVEIGANIGHHVQQRIRRLLDAVPGVKEKKFVDNLLIHEHSPDLLVNTLFMSFGNASLSQGLLPQDELQKLPKESFQMVFRKSSQYGPSSYVIASNGLPLDEEVHRNLSFSAKDIHYGAVVGAYALLEMVGFAFLHPLQPYVPPSLKVWENTSEAVRTESPHWPERGFHLHTQHPLELTEVLQGHDIPQFGPHGPHCRAHSHRHRTPSDGPGTGPYCERWEDMVGDVDMFFEWAVANRLNKIEWLLLDNYKWGDELSTRQHRLAALTALGHRYSLLIGADVPLGNIQQHGWHMVNVRLPLAQQAQQIRDRVDWVFGAGFDFLSTESGMSEFTHPECGLMVDLMNIFASYVNGTWGREAAIKVHCSTGQTCEAYLDPRTGDPINFNFLPTFTHSSLGIYPHTVQIYALDDPTAGSYGNANFSYMEDYLVYEAKQGKRAVSFYGETSYWVNVDIDVPLFLPLYGQRRQRDLRRLARRELAEGFKLAGQMNFDSGWEWGYWISDVITARTSWNPAIGTSCPPESSLQDEEQWTAYATSLTVVTDIFGPSIGSQLNALLVSLSRKEADLLLFGIVQGQRPEHLKKLSGIAYLSGTDTWVDLPRLFGLAFTQPDKVHLKEESDPLWPHALALIAEMVQAFQSAALEADAILMQAELAAREYRNDAMFSFSEGNSINPQALGLVREIRDCVQVLYLRAKQVQLLYSSRDLKIRSDLPAQRAMQLEARSVLQEAADIVSVREQHYRVSWQRIASWRENPTVYRYGYLWSVHKLYYWWRDQGLAEQETRQSEHSPCYLNRMDSTEVAVGWGRYTLEVLRTFINRYTPFSSLYPLEVVNCLSPPSKEYDFPRDLDHALT